MDDDRAHLMLGDAPSADPVRSDTTGQERQRMRFEAAKDAMQALLANPGGPVQANSRTGWSFTNCTADDVAHIAVELADALLAALEDTKWSGSR